MSCEGLDAYVTAEEGQQGAALCTGVKPAVGFEDGPSWVAQEHNAYTMQLATLPPVCRQTILDSCPQAAFDAASEISLVFLALDAEVFAVKAYRHYRCREKGEVFLRKLLSGAVHSRGMR